MFSLCIPTMDRYDRFLSKNLPRYLENEHVSEVVVRDENGNDADRIEKDFAGYVASGRLRVFRNATVLGPMMNKLAVCRDAASTWIALIDSDNFAGQDYFVAAADHIARLDGDSEGGLDATRFSLLAPSFARPSFDFRAWSGRSFDRETMKNLARTRSEAEVLLNCGNYVVHRHLVDNLAIADGEASRSPYDVFHTAVLMYEQFPMKIHVVPGMEYEHVVHPGSTWLTTHRSYGQFYENLKRRFFG